MKNENDLHNDKISELLWKIDKVSANLRLLRVMHECDDISIDALSQDIDTMLIGCEDELKQVVKALDSELRFYVPRTQAEAEIAKRVTQ